MHRLLRLTAAALMLAALWGVVLAGGASAQDGGNPDPGCVTGNPTGDCEHGNNDQAGGGVGCQGGSNAARTEPCGRGTGDTLNENGNVPGCTSRGDAVDRNPHCAPGEENPPPVCTHDCAPPPVCTHDCQPGQPTPEKPKPGTTTTTVTVNIPAAAPGTTAAPPVTSLPVTGVGSTPGTGETGSLPWLLAVAAVGLAAAGGALRPRRQR